MENSNSVWIKLDPSCVQICSFDAKVTTKISEGSRIEHTTVEHYGILSYIPESPIFVQ